MRLITWASPRTQPMRRPPQYSLQAEPIESTVAPLPSAAIGGGGSTSWIEMSHSV
jgi:hypothetical protein